MVTEIQTGSPDIAEVRVDNLLSTTGMMVSHDGYAWASHVKDYLAKETTPSDAATVLVKLLTPQMQEQLFSPTRFEREQVAESVTDGVQWILSEQPDVLDAILDDEKKVVEALSGLGSRFVRDNDGAIRNPNDPLENGVQIWAGTGGRNGYRWFRQPWGRDTFISLPGLLLSTGRHAEAEALLRIYAQFEQNGIIPNKIDDVNDPQSTAIYNSVDGSMWYLNALKSYLAVSDSENIDQEILQASRDVLASYRTGTRYEHMGWGDIRTDMDMLVEGPSQGTWMDAMPVESDSPKDPPVTPRGGKAVEVNALMKTNLETLAEVEQRHGKSEKANVLRQQALMLKKSFNERFVNPLYTKDSDQSPLYDLLDPIPAAKDFIGIPVDAKRVLESLQDAGYIDQFGHMTQKYYDDPAVLSDALEQDHELASYGTKIIAVLDNIAAQQYLVRPNMITAVSNGGELVDKEIEKAVFRIARDQLLTPSGAIRTLAPDSPGYHGEYSTDQPPVVKDMAYHQGTAWYYLIGPFADLTARVWPDINEHDRALLAKKAGLEPVDVAEKCGTLNTRQAFAEILKNILRPAIIRALTNPEPGGTLDEVSDGNYPYIDGGNSSQAWSVAEILRVYTTYIATPA